MIKVSQQKHTMFESYRAARKHCNATKLKSLDRKRECEKRKYPFSMKTTL